MSTGQPKRGVEAGRLALRVEGEYWEAYFATTETMEGAIHLGSIRIALVEQNYDLKEAFMEAMKQAVAFLLEEATGAKPSWLTPRRAPERDRSGSA